VGVAVEAFLPQPVAQNHLLPVAGDFVAAVELMAARGVQAQHVKESGGHLERRKPLRLAGSGKLQVAARESGERFKRSVPRAKIAKVERV